MKESPVRGQCESQIQLQDCTRSERSVKTLAAAITELTRRSMKTISITGWAAHTLVTLWGTFTNSRILNITNALSSPLNTRIMLNILMQLCLGNGSNLDCMWMGEKSSVSLHIKSVVEKVWIAKMNKEDRCVFIWRDVCAAVSQPRQPGGKRLGQSSATCRWRFCSATWKNKEISTHLLPWCRTRDECLVLSEH